MPFPLNFRLLVEWVRISEYVEGKGGDWCPRIDTSWRNWDRFFVRYTGPINGGNAARSGGLCQGNGVFPLLSTTCDWAARPSFVYFLFYSVRFTMVKQDSKKLIIFEFQYTIKVQKTKRSCVEHKSQCFKNVWLNHNMIHTPYHYCTVSAWGVRCQQALGHPEQVSNHT